MLAWTKRKYGGPEILQLEEIAKPPVKDGEIRVRVMANCANPADWHIIRGDPFFARFSTGLFKPSEKVAGADFAGVVEEVGSKVTHFSPGDRVFGETINGGAFAEYVSAPAGVCGKMPPQSGFAEMACVPIAGLTALQALVTHAKLQKGESVLINGSSGGVGHFAVQIAKAMGAEVTGVCSERNVDFVRSLGADRVIAYDKEDIHSHNGRYNLVVDTHGNLTHRDYRRMGDRGVIVGFTTLGKLATLLLRRAVSKYPLAQFTAQANTEDLEKLASLIGEGRIRPNIEKTYTHHQIPEAIGYIEAMRTRGKVAMVWEGDNG